MTTESCSGRPPVSPSGTESATRRSRCFQVASSRAPALVAALTLCAVLAACDSRSEQAPDEPHVASTRQGVTVLRNLAYGKPTSQSSTYPGGSSITFSSDKAVDGKVGYTFPFLDRAVITHTGFESRPSWQVDLQTIEFVNQVVIYNRFDCCADRLSNFDVLLSADGTSWTSYYFPTQPPSPLVIDVDQPARYVKVQLRGSNYLSLDEVQVLQTSKGRNLAQGRPAAQSSTDGDAAAERAVDGNTDGKYASGSVTHTGLEASPWWQVDLGSSRYLGQVVLHNRTDCCADRLTDFDVKISDDLLTWQTVSYSGPQTFPLTVPLYSKGRYVRVQLRGTGILSLAEVQVLPDPPNLALRRPASQSSTGSGGTADRAVDGNTDGDFWHGSVTHSDETYAAAFWTVDLGAPRTVSHVVVYNRTDCCAGRLSNYRVGGSLDGTSYTYAPAQPFATDQGTYVPLRGVYRYIRIDKPGILSLAEVKVQGSDVPCAPGQALLDGTKCVTLTPWTQSSDVGPGSRIAMRLRSWAPVGAWDRWIGIVDPGSALTALDLELSSRDVFSIDTFAPTGVSGFSLPWFNLRASNGRYVQAPNVSLASYAYFTADGTEATALTFTRGSGTPLSSNLQHLLSFSPTVRNEQWGNRQAFIDAVNARKDYFYVTCMALTSVRAAGDPSSGFWDKDTCTPTSLVDFFVVK